MSTIGALTTNSLAGLSGVTSCGTKPCAKGAASDGDSASVSGFGQFLSKKQAREKTNPGQAKQVLTDIATKLSGQALQSSGTEADRLNQLAAKFRDAAQSGNLAALTPPPPPAGGATHVHAGHHHRALEGYQNNQGQSLVDMMNSVLSTDTAAAAAAHTGSRA